MKNEKKPKHFIKTPSYPGGQEALRKFIKENLRYPKEAVEKKIEGTVAVKFDLDHNGKVTDAKIKHSLGYGCDEEAIRVVRLLKFGGAQNRGVKAIFHKNINIHFRLKEILKQTEKRITFTYKESTKSKEASKPAEPKKTYTYTIIRNSRS